MRATHNGRKFVASSVILQVIPNEKETFRVGFTTTKKLGCAVIRNKIRRRLREAVRLIFAPKALIGYDYVFIGRYNMNLDKGSDECFGFKPDKNMYILDANGVPQKARDYAECWEM